MQKEIASGAAVLVLMPVVWIASATWSTVLSLGIVAHEAGHRLARALGWR